MATQTHGSVMGVLVNGYDLSPFHNSISDSGSVEAVDETCFGPLGTPTTNKSYIAGQEDATVDLGGKYVIDHAVGAPNQDQVADVLEAAIRAATKPIVVTFPFGDGFGKNCSGYQADETSYDVQGAVSSILTVSSKFQSSTGTDALSVLHALAAEAAGTINGADLDAGAAYAAGSWKGIVAYLHVTDVTGATPSVIAKVQHSADGVTWTDLVTFAAITAKHKAARMQVLGNVNRHLRVQAVVAAGSTATFHLSAGRIPA